MGKHIIEEAQNDVEEERTGQEPTIGSGRAGNATIPPALQDPDTFCNEEGVFRDRIYRYGGLGKYC